MRAISLNNNGIRGDYPYFRDVWRRVVAVLLAAAFLPLLTVGGGMYLYGISVVKQETVRSLEKEVLHHRNALDAFLAERVRDLQFLADNNTPESLTRPGILHRYFSSLQERLPCFEDLGVIDAAGQHLAYVGPYDLLSRKYDAEPWFREVMKHPVYVSDVFLGFRRHPHFIIAVRQENDRGIWVLRATVKADFFQEQVAFSAGPNTKDAFLLNAEGAYQTQPRLAGRRMARSPLTIPEKFTGVRMVESQGDLFLMAWQKTLPWITVVQVSEKQVYDLFLKAKTMGIFALLLSTLLIVLSVSLTTNYLVSLLEKKNRHIGKLDHHLRRCAFLASSMELSFHFFREIRDALSNMDVTVRLVSEKTTGMNDADVQRGIEQIHDEIGRVHKEIEKFTRFISHREPLIGPVDLHLLLEDLLQFLEGELTCRTIQVETRFSDSLPVIESDPSKLHQVFQSLLLNALQAVERNGRISLQTWPDQDMAVVEIADDGPGIPASIREKIFEPLFSTRREGTGLGLSVSRSLLEKLGGRITVTSEPGAGAKFQVRLPQKFSISADAVEEIEDSVHRK